MATLEKLLNVQRSMRLDSMANCRPYRPFASLHSRPQPDGVGLFERMDRWSGKARSENPPHEHFQTLRKYLSFFIDKRQKIL